MASRGRGRAVGDVHARQQRPAASTCHRARCEQVIAGRRRPVHDRLRRAGPRLRQQLGRRPAGQGRPAGAVVRARRSGSTRGPASPTTARVSVLGRGRRPLAAGQDDPGRPAPQRHGRQHDRPFVYVANANSDTVSVIDTDDRRGRRNDRLPARGPAAVRQRLQRPGPQPRRRARSTSPTAPTTASPSSASARRRRRGARPPPRASSRRRPDPDRLVSRRRARLGRRQDSCSSPTSRATARSAEPRPAGRRARTRTTTSARVSIIDVPDAAQLAEYTAAVNANNRLAYSLAGLEKPRPDVEAGAGARSGTASRRSSSTSSTSSRRTAPTTRSSAT